MAAGLNSEILQALKRQCIDPVDACIVSPLGVRKGRRLAYRVDGRCGTRVKVRQFESAAIACSIQEYRIALSSAFAPVISRYESVLIEEWIAGRGLAGDDEKSRLEEAGAILGELHRQSKPLGGRTIPTREWKTHALRDLALLADNGLITIIETAALHHKVTELDPLAAETSLIHYDYCGENMLIDADGNLRIIDNEQLTIAPAGLDLGWTFVRWPAAACSSVFHRGYRHAAGAYPGACGFWRTVAALLAARVYHRCAPAKLPAVLDLLRQLAQGRHLSVTGGL